MAGVMDDPVLLRIECGAWISRPLLGRVRKSVGGAYLQPTRQRIKTQPRVIDDGGLVLRPGRNTSHYQPPEVLLDDGELWVYCGTEHGDLQVDPAAIRDAIRAGEKVLAVHRRA